MSDHYFLNLGYSSWDITDTWRYDGSIVVMLTDFWSNICQEKMVGIGRILFYRKLNRKRLRKHTIMVSCDSTNRIPIGASQKHGSKPHAEHETTKNHKCNWKRLYHQGSVLLTDRKSTRLNSSHALTSRMPSSA